MSSTIEMKPGKEGKEKRFIKVESSREHYKAEACIVWCFDARFGPDYDVFLADRGITKESGKKVDLVSRAGGAKALAMEGSPEQADVMKQIRGSIDLHHADRVVLMVHIDCGGYGGSKAFDNDHQKEWDHHIAELEKAAAVVQGEFPEIKYIETWIVDMDGLHEIGEDIAHAVAA
jgi:hypothetical protein